MKQPVNDETLTLESATQKDNENVGGGKNGKLYLTNFEFVLTLQNFKQTGRTPRSIPRSVLDALLVFPTYFTFREVSANDPGFKGQRVVSVY